MSLQNQIPRISLGRCTCCPDLSTCTHKQSWLTFSHSCISQCFLRHTHSDRAPTRQNTGRGEVKGDVSGAQVLPLDYPAPELLLLEENVCWKSDSNVGCKKMKICGASHMLRMSAVVQDSTRSCILRKWRFIVGYYLIAIPDITAFKFYSVSTDHTAVVHVLQITPKVQKWQQWNWISIMNGHIRRSVTWSFSVLHDKGAGGGRANANSYVMWSHLCSCADHTDLWPVT